MRFRAEFMIRNRRYVVVSEDPNMIIREFAKAMAENFPQNTSDRRNYIKP